MRPDVLFVCVHNAGRSQMAKALFNARAVEQGLPLRAESAGTMPGTRVHPEVLQAMREVNIDISDGVPQLLTDEMLAGNPRVFTMGCAVDSQACPSLRLERVVDWALPDPKGRPIAEVRQIRDKIALLVEGLLTEMSSTLGGRQTPLHDRGQVSTAQDRH